MNPLLTDKVNKLTINLHPLSVSVPAAPRWPCGTSPLGPAPPGRTPAWLWPPPSGCGFLLAGSCLSLPTWWGAGTKRPQVRSVHRRKEQRDACESGGADLKQSMWMAWLALYSPWLSFWKPISRCMFSPCSAARVSTKGLMVSGGGRGGRSNTAAGGGGRGEEEEEEEHDAGGIDSPVEEVSVVRHKDVGLGFLHVIEPALDQSRLHGGSHTWNK